MGVPIIPFFMSIFLGMKLLVPFKAICHPNPFSFSGLMPYNYICVQAAATLSQLNSFADILSFDVVMKLLSISALALIPAVWGDKIAAWARRRGNGGVDVGDEVVKEQQA